MTFVGWRISDGGRLDACKRAPKRLAKNILVDTMLPLPAAFQMLATVFIGENHVRARVCTCILVNQKRNAVTSTSLGRLRPSPCCDVVHVENSARSGIITTTVCEDGISFYKSLGIEICVCAHR